ncbi:MAG TPA: PAS domain S-box protein, partial [Rhodothermales bacterium]
MSEGGPTGSVRNGTASGVLDAVLAAVREPVLVLDRSRRVLFASTAFCEKHGVGDGDLLGRTLFEITDGAFDVPALRELLELDGSGTGSVSGVEVTFDFTRLGGRTLLVNALRDDDRGVVVLAMEDVTESRRSLTALQEFSQRFELFTENVREYAIFAMDESGLITLWNPGAERILGWTEEEVLGKSGEIIFTPEDRALGIPRRELETADRDGQALDDRWQTRKDGTRFWASGVTTALKDSGPTRGFVKILRDNTRRKQAETELEESHRWLRRILQVTPDVVALYDLKADRLGFVSPHVIASLGYRREDFYTLDRDSFMRILHPDDLARGSEVRKVLREYSESAPYEISLRVFDAERKQRWYHVRVVPFRREPNGRVREVLVVARDFTEIHETQEELHRLTETLERRVEQRTAQVRTLASTLTMAEQQERRRISQILHDDVQQRLYGIQMKM